MNVRAKIFSVAVFLFAGFIVFATIARAVVVLSNDSVCVSISPPTAPVYEGYKYTAVVTMTNTGENNWSTGGGYSLGAVGNTLNWGSNRVPLPNGTVLPGQNVTFPFTITVDAAPGTYSFSWRMVREPESTYGFFGATCTASITVLPSPYALYSPLMLKNHPAGYVPDATKATENSPYYDIVNGSNANEKQWSYLSVNNPGSSPLDVNVTLYRNDGTKLTNFTKNIPAGDIWNAFNDSSWEPQGSTTHWVDNWVKAGSPEDKPGVADDSVVGWAKVVPVAPAAGSAPLPVFGQQRLVINEPKVDATSGKPIPGSVHLLTDMSLTSSASASLYGGYYMRNWSAGYPNDGAVIQNTYMNIANPNNSSAAVALKIYETDGTLHHTLNKTISAFGSWYAYGDPTGSGGWNDIPFIDTVNNKSLGWVEITSDKPVTGFNRTLALKPSDTNGTRILTDFPLAPPSSSVNLYTSLFVQNHSSGFTSPITGTQIPQWSYLTLHNPGSTAATATIKVYPKAGGTPASYSKSIPAHGTYFAKNDTTGWDAVNIGTLGWVEVTSTNSVPLVGINRVSIGGQSGTSHHYWTDYPMDFLGSRALYAPYFLKDHSSGYWESGVVQRSYIHIANPSNSSATVTIRVLTPQGTEHKKWNETILSKNSWVSIDDTDWTGITGLTYGWVELSSTQPIVATNRVTYAKSGAAADRWLRLMTDAPLTSPPPASLGVLNVVPDTATLAVQGPAYGRTGLRTTESGSNFYNAITITPKIENGSDSNVALVGAAFAQAPPAGGKAYIHSIEGDNPLDILQTRANNTNGFILLYANKTTAVDTQTGTQTFTAGNYYMYFNGAWDGPKAPDEDLLQPVTFGQPANGLTVRIDAGNTGNAATKPKFSATLYATIDNRSWTTYGYLMNINGESKSEVRNACKTPVTSLQSPDYTNPLYCF